VPVEGRLFAQRTVEEIVRRAVADLIRVATPNVSRLLGAPT
jgi:hypothetical protein